MKVRTILRSLVVLGAMALVVGACNNSGSADLTTTSSLVATTNPDSGATTTSVVPGADSTTTTTLVGEDVPGFEIVARESAPAGETLYIVVPPSDAYTDVDIENFVRDLYESGTATFGAEVFDDAAAVDAYRKDPGSRTNDEEDLIALHHLASLVNGSTIKFQGPFESSGEMAVGS
jgi:hypothetical protein